MDAFAALLILLGQFAILAHDGSTVPDIHLNDTFFIRVFRTVPQRVALRFLQWTSSGLWFASMALAYAAFRWITGISLNNARGRAHFWGSFTVATIFWVPRIRAGLRPWRPGWHTVSYGVYPFWENYVLAVVMLAALGAFAWNIAGALRNAHERTLAGKKWGRPQATPKNPD